MIQRGRSFISPRKRVCPRVLLCSMGKYSERIKRLLCLVCGVFFCFVASQYDMMAMKKPRSEYIWISEADYWDKGMPHRLFCTAPISIIIIFQVSFSFLYNSLFAVNAWKEPFQRTVRPRFNFVRFQSMAFSPKNLRRRAHLKLSWGLHLTPVIWARKWLDT